MNFSEINPFIRYARYLKLEKNSFYDEVVPLDARIFYALNGYGKIKVENTEYEMSEHSLLIINSGVPYQIIPPENPITYIVINFDYTQISSFYTMPIKPISKDLFKKEMLVDCNVFNDIKTLSKVLYISKIEFIQTKLTAVVSEYMQKLLFHEQKSGHLLAECIADAVRFLKIGNNMIKKDSSSQIITYIHNHYSENMTNHSLGKLFGYHPNYISSLIKQITDMPIHQYIIYVRLINAINFLENSTLSVSEIATACGFCDVAYFSSYFKKYFCISPSKYRNL